MDVTSDHKCRQLKFGKEKIIWILKFKNCQSLTPEENWCNREFGQLSVAYSEKVACEKLIDVGLTVKQNIMQKLLSETA